MNHKGEGNNEESKKIDENCLNRIEIFFLVAKYEDD